MFTPLGPQRRDAAPNSFRRTRINSGILLLFSISRMTRHYRCTLSWFTPAPSLFSSIVGYRPTYRVYKSDEKSVARARRKFPIRKKNSERETRASNAGVAPASSSRWFSKFSSTTKLVLAFFTREAVPRWHTYATKKTHEISMAVRVVEIEKTRFFHYASLLRATLTENRVTQARGFFGADLLASLFHAGVFIVTSNFHGWKTRARFQKTSSRNPSNSKASKIKRHTARGLEKKKTKKKTGNRRITAVRKFSLASFIKIYYATATTRKTMIHR